MFERTTHIGGRTLTVNVYGNASHPVELGASVFVPANKILYGAAKEFGLDTRGGFNGDRLMTVWDGDRFVFESDDGSAWWWELGKLVWKYGLAPLRLKRLRDTTVNAFLNMYEAPLFPFRSLTEAAAAVALDQATAVTGEEMLAGANVGWLL